VYSEKARESGRGREIEKRVERSENSGMMVRTRGDDDAAREWIG
jgi:hypothetical protein